MPEQEQEQEAKKEKANNNKVDKIKSIAIGYTKVLFIGLCFVLAFFVASYVSKLKYEKSSFDIRNRENDIFVFPRQAKNKPLATFRFSTLRQKEEKQFKIRINSPKTSVSTTMFLAYDEQNINLQDELISREIELQDKIQYIIALKDYEDISTVSKRNSYLKLELINGINSLLLSGQVLDIYFGHFFINTTK